MPEASSDWRVGSRYDYFDDLAPEQVAFEFLRRHPDYAPSYRRLKRACRDSAEPAPAPFSARWGLRFRGRSGEPNRPSLDHLDAGAQSTLGDSHRSACTPPDRPDPGRGTAAGDSRGP